MNNYELTFVLSAALSEAKQKEILAKLEKEIKEAGGKVEKTSEWGKRELAYPIKKQTEGVYYFMEVSLPADKTAEINRMLVTKEEVLRHLIVRSTTSSKGTTSTTSKNEKSVKSGKIKEKRKKKNGDKKS